MMLARTLLLGLAATLGSLEALPTMIRLGYPNCASCHVSPQGGGLLNEYGRGIDEAQSLRAGEYKPRTGGISSALSLGGRINQDLRWVAQEQTDSDRSVLKWRLFYRNVTELGKGFRVSATIASDVRGPARRALPYEQPVRPGSLFVNTALVHYKPASNVEIAAGIDALPTGLNLPDQNLFIKSRNRLGYYDTPAQVKLFWWGKRFHVNPYAFAPGGQEPATERESGGGALAEFYPWVSGRLAVGVNALHASGRTLDRTMAGAYARVGLGSWGLFAEHDYTTRKPQSGAHGSFSQNASFAQVFWAIEEWLVAYAGVERLRVEHPFAEARTAGKFELAARLTSQVTLSAGTRMERDAIRGRTAPALTVQLAIKTLP